MDKQRYQALDGLRGICAVFVCLFHFRANNPLTEAAFIRGSWQFVDLFFVISGFVMAASYGDRLADGMTTAKFTLLRLGRLYPLHLAMLAVFVGFELLAAVVGTSSHRAPFSGTHAASAIFSNLLLVQSGFGIEPGLTWNTPAWSIATEFWTCVLFAAGVHLLGFRSWWVAACALFGGICYAMTWGEPIDSSLLRCIYGFGIGVLCWKLLKRGVVVPSSRVLWTGLEVAACIAVVVIVAAGGSALTTLVFAPVVLIFAVARGAVSAVVSTRALQFVGMLSYSIYLVHLFVQNRLDDLLRAAGYDVATVVGGVPMLGRSPAEGLALTLLMLVLVVAASVVTYHLIEMPGQAWVRRQVRSRSGARASTEPTAPRIAGDVTQA